ncbi:uncharacterized protein LOC109816600 [Cajanus cajan]|uniref:Uncharacterized protein n=1 Tax=Cajanus cajan TaxID=3821 RepID=A0A151U9I3_CAJCA|nr:uncharacterized protein LOC109816600 [Cajanus cajan]KYP75963.1 hypothetical protein KK1_020176 [Cajanus cajan]
MSPKLFSLNFLLERKRPQETTDELAIVKAAARAWYQHGSGSEGKAKSEYDVTRTQRVARPSRYKLEAMRMAKEKAPSIHTNKPLLDTYEVQCISRQLNRLIVSGHNKLSNSNNSTNNNDGNRRMKNEKRIRKGYFPRHAVECRGGDEEVGGTALSAKCVPVVNLAKCLPRVNHSL